MVSNEQTLRGQVYMANTTFAGPVKQDYYILTHWFSSDNKYNVNLSRKIRLDALMMRESYKIRLFKFCQALIPSFFRK